jgi:hypothetical protein
MRNSVAHENTPLTFDQILQTEARMRELRLIGVENASREERDVLIARYVAHRKAGGGNPVRIILR